MFWGFTGLEYCCFEATELLKLQCSKISLQEVNIFMPVQLVLGFLSSHYVHMFAFIFDTVLGTISKLKHHTNMMIIVFMNSNLHTYILYCYLPKRAFQEQ